MSSGPNSIPQSPEHVQPQEIEVKITTNPEGRSDDLKVYNKFRIPTIESIRQVAMQYEIDTKRNIARVLDLAQNQPLLRLLIGLYGMDIDDDLEQLIKQETVHTRLVQMGFLYQFMSRYNVRLLDLALMSSDQMLAYFPSNNALQLEAAHVDVVRAELFDRLTFEQQV